MRVRAVVAYDGSPFHGFAEQPDVKTVGGELRIALERMLGKIDEFTCAGRTDTGVHALGQVVHFDIAGAEIDEGRLQRSLNKQLSPSIVVREIAQVDEGFSARFSAKARRYKYTVLNDNVPDPFTANTSWWVSEPLDVEAMNQACEEVVGERDFTSFCRRPKTDEEVSLTRNVRKAKWTRVDNRLEFDIEANAFCHQMVRALTGMLVEIGRGRRQVADMARAIDAKDRAMAAPLAPPQGLCLREVLY